MFVSSAHILAGVCTGQAKRQYARGPVVVPCLSLPCPLGKACVRICRPPKRPQTSVPPKQARPRCQPLSRQHTPVSVELLARRLIGRWPEADAPGLLHIDAPKKGPVPCRLLRSGGCPGRAGTREMAQHLSSRIKESARADYRCPECVKGLKRIRKGCPRPCRKRATRDTLGLTAEERLAPE